MQKLQKTYSVVSSVFCRYFAYFCRRGKAFFRWDVSAFPALSVKPARRSFIFATIGLYPPSHSWSYSSHGAARNEQIFVIIFAKRQCLFLIYLPPYLSVCLSMKTTSRINSFISFIQVALFFSDELCAARSKLTHTYTRSLC